jgi:hypothetical protein
MHAMRILSFAVAHFGIGTLVYKAAGSLPLVLGKESHTKG